MLLNVEINMNYATYSFDNYEVARLIAHSRMAAIGNDERKTKKTDASLLVVSSGSENRSNYSSFGPTTVIDVSSRATY